MLDTARLVEDYVEWLRARIVWRHIGEWVEITTPYIDRHNDYIQIYLRSTSDGFILTDDSATITDLTESGCELNTPKRRGLLESTLAGYGVRLEGHALQVSATESNFALRKHSLVQAMLAVNDLFNLAEPTVASLFVEDVQHWLDEIGARYMPQVKLAGRSGYDHLFDFAIPHSKEQPERLLKVINHPNKEHASLAAFAWSDTKATRHPGSRAFAILNDVGNHVAANVAQALKAYEVKPVLWSRKEEAAEELAA